MKHFLADIEFYKSNVDPYLKKGGKKSRNFPFNCRILDQMSTHLFSPTTLKHNLNFVHIQVPTQENVKGKTPIEKNVQQS